MIYFGSKRGKLEFFDTYLIQSKFRVSLELFGVYRYISLEYKLKTVSGSFPELTHMETLLNNHQLITIK